jgi:cytoskeletal protein RodZ
MTIEGLGKKFQEARLARGLTLDEAARLTKIRPSRLAEIEADDFSQFPSLAYAKGFLQIYGKFLDVDVTPYLDAFETSSQQMTVDGYAYLQDQPAPKPRRIRARPRAPVVRRQRSGDRSSPLPLLIAVGVIALGFILMRLIMNIQRIAPHQMVGVPQPTASQAPPAQAQPTQAPVAQAPPKQAPAASIAPLAPAPSRAPSRPPAAVVEAQPKKAPPVASAPPSIAPAPSPPPQTAVAEVPKKAAQPVATVAPSIPIPEAFVPAFANANAAAKASVPPKEPEVRRAEPVRPEDLAKADATQTAQTTQKPAEAEGPNHIAIKPLKKTYIKVVVDNESLQPAFERWISPTDGTVEFRGQKIAVRVLDRDAVQIRKNGKPVSGDDDDVTVE